MTPLDTVMLELRVPSNGRQRRHMRFILPCIVVAFALAGPLHAQTCSGGVDGGMDATGNLCNFPVTTMLAASTEATAKAVVAREGAAWEASEPTVRTASVATGRMLAAARDAGTRPSIRQGTK
jgi:hypothetical protein